MIRDVKEKYSCQAGVHYNKDASLGKNLKNGASVAMKREAVEYGIQARTLLIKICCLLMKHRIVLGQPDDHARLAKDE